MASLIDSSGRPLKAREPAGPAPTPAKAPAGGTQVPVGPGAAPIKETSLETFAADVLDASMEAPVIVDFWAPWCGPCKTLGPQLEAAVLAAKGAVKMVKVNIDENPEIAQQLRIQSIPTVYAFKNGQPVDGFMGAVPESQIKSFVQALIGPDAGGGAAADLLAAAEEALAARDLTTAAQAYAQILQEEPGHPKAVAGLANCYLESGDTERARQTLGLVRPDGATDEAIRTVEAKLVLKESAKEAGDIAPLKAKVDDSPADLQARYDLALALDASGARDGAIEQLLEIIKRERKWNEDAARKQLVTLFEAMGPMDERTIAARRRLSALLFS